MSVIPLVPGGTCCHTGACFVCCYRTLDPYSDRATAKLLGAALGGDSSDIEMGSTGIAAAFAPSWVQRSEKIKAEMGILKERINKLKE